MNPETLEQCVKSIQLYVGLNDKKALEETIQKIFKAGVEIGIMKANFHHKSTENEQIR